MLYCSLGKEIFKESNITARLNVIGLNLALFDKHPLKIL